MKVNTKQFVVFLLIVISFSFRLIPHFPNFVPMAAVALLCASFFSNLKNIFFIIMGLWFFTDVLINNVFFKYYQDFTWFTFNQVSVVLCFGIMLFLYKKYFKSISVKNILVGSLSFSLLFFITSNFVVWAEGVLYPHSLNGLISCYIMAIPFYKTSFIADLLFSFLYFGILQVLFQPHRSKCVSYKK